MCFFPLFNLLLLESPVECVFVFGLEFWFWAESRFVFFVCGFILSICCVLNVSSRTSSVCALGFIILAMASPLHLRCADCWTF